MDDSVILKYFLLSLIILLFYRVAKNELVNKMSLHNLATVFGPTLLRPAEEKSMTGSQTFSQNTLMLNALQLDVHYQVDAV